MEKCLPIFESEGKPAAVFAPCRDQEAAGDVVEPIPVVEVETFKAEHREEYVMSEMELRRLETTGTERVMSKKSTFLVIHNMEKGETSIQWKAGRAKRQDVFPRMTLEEARQGLQECLSGDRVTVLEVATHYPEYYWTLRLALAEQNPPQSLEDYLESHLKKGRRVE